MKVEDNYLQQAKAESIMTRSSRFANPGSIDNWRHTRMLDMTRPLISAKPQANWMTVGDGRYGSDAAYLEAQGVDVLATSLTDDNLRTAHAEGLISKYARLNAEDMPLPDDYVDFVLCKESYHHFPRPPMALYEMLRVASEGVILIEPLDDAKPLNHLKAIIKRLIRGNQNSDFEPSGNYIYKPSVREVMKLLTAMGGRCIAVKGLNDFYVSSLSDYDASSLNPGSIVTKLGILCQDCLAKAGLLGYGLGAIIIFKRAPSLPVVNKLRQDCYKIIELPINPYAPSGP